MSVFIKFKQDEISELQGQVKKLKSKLIDANSSTIEVKRNIRDKRILLNESFLHANEAHKDLSKIISLMPRIDSVPMNVHDVGFMNSENNHETLVKLSDKISKLR